MNIAHFYKKKIKENKNDLFFFDENFSITYHDFDCYVNNCVKYLTQLAIKIYSNVFIAKFNRSIDNLLHLFYRKNFCPLDCDRQY